MPARPSPGIPIPPSRTCQANPLSVRWWLTSVPVLTLLQSAARLFPDPAQGLPAPSGFPGVWGCLLFPWRLCVHLYVLSSQFKFLDFIFHVMFVLFPQRDDRVFGDRDPILGFPAFHVTTKMGSQKAQHLWKNGNSLPPAHEPCGSWGVTCKPTGQTC